jgi:hypothetical protein
MNRPPKANEYREFDVHFRMGHVSATEVPTMSVKIDPISFWLNGNVFVEYGGGITPALVSPVSGAKWVLVCLNYNASQVVPMIVNGTPATNNPPFPVPPKGYLPLGAVYLNSGITTVTQSMIYDIRPVFSAGSYPVAHADLSGRDVASSHPISAISGLQDALDDKLGTEELDIALADKADVNGTTAVEFVFNKDEDGTPSSTVSMMVERGNLPNAGIRWNEDTDKWQVSPGDASWYDLESGAPPSPANTIGLGSVKISVAAVDPAFPVAVGDNDPRLLTTQEKTDILALDGRVDDVETLILDKADVSALADKADVSALNTLGGRVTTVEGALPGKAAASDLSALTGRVNVAESDILSKASNTDLGLLDTRVGAVETGKANLVHSHSIPGTKMIYVDNKRSDSYTADGSLMWPYKSVLAAIPGATVGSVIKLMPSDISYGNILLPDGVSLMGSGMHRTVVGDITTGITTCDMSDLQFTGKLTVNATLSGENLFTQGTGTVEINKDVNVANFSMFANSDTPLTIKGGLSVFSRSTIKTQGNQPTISQEGGSLILSVCAVEGVSTGQVIVSTAGSMRLLNTSIVNTGSLNGVDLNNGATSGAPNVLMGVMTPNNIVCGNAITMVGNIFGGGSLTGNALVKVSSELLSYDNTVSGLSAINVKLAVDELANEKLDKGSLNTTVTFYAADSNGGTVNKLHTVTIDNGLITSWDIA